MSTRVTIKMDSTHKILLKRALEKDGGCQQLLTNEVARLCDLYIPFLQGVLKNNKYIGKNYLLYNSPYAAKQFYKNSGNGKEGMNHGGLRGKQWHSRMWGDRGHEILSTIRRKAGIK